MGDAIYEGTHDFSSATITGTSFAIKTFDAVVASSGGDYTTLQAAITGGATSIFIRDGTYTATANITLPNYCTIVGESWNAIINMAGYTLNMGTYNKIMDCRITTSSNANLIVVKANSTIENVFIVCTRNSNPTSQIGYITDNNVAAIRVRVIDVQFDLVPISGTDLSNKTAIWMQNAGSDFHHYRGIGFGGSTTSQCRQFFHNGNSITLEESTFGNCGTAAGATIVSIAGSDCSVSNLSFSSSSGAVAFTGDRITVTGLTVYGISHILYIQGDGSTISSCTSIGQLNMQGDHGKVSASCFSSVTIAGNNNTLSAVTAGALAGGGSGTITISSGTTNCITSCHTDAAISDSGTSTVLANNTVF